MILILHCVCWVQHTDHIFTEYVFILFFFIIILFFYCAICRAFNFFTLSRREPTSTRKQPGKKITLIIYWQSAKERRAHVFLFFACASKHARACVFYWKNLWTEEEVPYGLSYSLETTPNNLLPPHRRGLLRLQTAFLRSGKEAHTLFGYFFFSFFGF